MEWYWIKASEVQIETSGASMNSFIRKCTESYVVYIVCSELFQLWNCWDIRRHHLLYILFCINLYCIVGLCICKCKPFNRGLIVHAHDTQPLRQRLQKKPKRNFSHEIDYWSVVEIGVRNLKQKAMSQTVYSRIVCWS